MPRMDVVGYSRTSARPAATEGNLVPLRAWRDGTLSTADLIDIYAAEGRLFIANFGTVATQLTFLAQAANRPDFWVRVPTGTVCVPVSLDLVLGAMAGTVTTIDVRHCANDIGNGTSSAASVGPVASQTNPTVAVASTCTPRQLATADTTAETTPITDYKEVFIRADDAGSDQKSLHLNRSQLKNPFLIGPATWEAFVWATSTQATGYAVMAWLELPTADFFS